MFLCSAILHFVYYLCCSPHNTKDVHTDNVPRAPAMNPKIRAFSARLTLFPVHSHKKTWFAVILLQFATVSPGIHESKPESVNPNPKINQDHLQVAQTIFASYMTRELNYFGDFNASGTPQGYFNKIILFVSEYGEETL